MYDDYNAKEAAMQSIGNQAIQYTPPTARKQLTQKQAMLQQELERVNKALEALDKYPELEEFSEAIKAALR